MDTTKQRPLRANTTPEPDRTQYPPGTPSTLRTVLERARLSGTPVTLEAARWAATGLLTRTTAGLKAALVADRKAPHGTLLRVDGLHTVRRADHPDTILWRGP